MLNRLSPHSLHMEDNSSKGFMTIGMGKLKWPPAVDMVRTTTQFILWIRSNGFQSEATMLR